MPDAYTLTLELMEKKKCKTISPLEFKKFYWFNKSLMEENLSKIHKKLPGNKIYEAKSSKIVKRSKLKKKAVSLTRVLLSKRLKNSRQTYSFLMNKNYLNLKEKVYFNKRIIRNIEKTPNKFRNLFTIHLNKENTKRDHVEIIFIRNKNGENLIPKQQQNFRRIKTTDKSRSVYYQPNNKTNFSQKINKKNSIAYEKIFIKGIKEQPRACTENFNMNALKNNLNKLKNNPDNSSGNDLKIENNSSFNTHKKTAVSRQFDGPIKIKNNRYNIKLTFNCEKIPHMNNGSNNSRRIAFINENKDRNDNKNTIIKVNKTKRNTEFFGKLNTFSPLQKVVSLYINLYNLKNSLFYFYILN